MQLHKGVPDHLTPLEFRHTVLVGEKMPSVYSNSPSAKDWVRRPFEQLARSSTRLWLASPFFTEATSVLEAVALGKPVQLLVGLNPATRPDALRQVHGQPGVAIRFYTHRFHAKLFIFDDGALIGSSNLTNGGLFANREGTVVLDPQEDSERYGEVQALFAELWTFADVLTETKLVAFTKAWAEVNSRPDPQKVINKQVGQREPPNIAVKSTATSKTRDFLESLRRDVYERFRPAFLEIHDLLVHEGLRRPELASVHRLHETNRFLNWVRLTHVHGDDAWRLASLRSPDERRKMVADYGKQWVQADKNLVPPVFFEWLENVARQFGTLDSVEVASKDDIGEALMSLHAFTAQLRFVKGGLSKVLPEFWNQNKNEVERVRSSIQHLLHGGGDFAERLHDVLYDPALKLRMFGKFTALELFGTVHPEQFPPVNGRMVKAMRFLGYPVA